MEKVVGAIDKPVNMVRKSSKLRYQIVHSTLFNRIHTNGGKIELCERLNPAMHFVKNRKALRKWILKVAIPQFQNSLTPVY